MINGMKKNTSTKHMKKGKSFISESAAASSICRVDPVEQECPTDQVLYLHEWTLRGVLGMLLEEAQPLWSDEGRYQEENRLFDLILPYIPTEAFERTGVSPRLFRALVLRALRQAGAPLPVQSECPGWLLEEMIHLLSLDLERCTLCRTHDRECYQGQRRDSPDISHGRNRNPISRLKGQVLRWQPNQTNSQPKE